MCCVTIHWTRAKRRRERLRCHGRTRADRGCGPLGRLVVSNAKRGARSRTRRGTLRVGAVCGRAARGQRAEARGGAGGRVAEDVPLPAQADQARACRRESNVKVKAWAETSGSDRERKGPTSNARWTLTAAAHLVSEAPTEPRSQTQRSQSRVTERALRTVRSKPLTARVRRGTPDHDREQTPSWPRFGIRHTCAAGYASSRLSCTATSRDQQARAARQRRARRRAAAVRSGTRGANGRTAAAAV